MPTRAELLRRSKARQDVLRRRQAPKRKPPVRGVTPPHPTRQAAPPTPAVVSQPPTPTIAERLLEQERLQYGAREGKEPIPYQAAQAYPGIPGGPGLSLPLTPTMTPLLQKLYRQQVSPYGTVAGPGITTRGPTGGIGGPAPAAEPYVGRQEWWQTELGREMRTLAGMHQASVARERAAAQRPELQTGGGTGGGGWGYTPRRYTVAGGGVRGQAAVARGAGLVNWRIGL